MYFIAWSSYWVIVMMLAIAFTLPQRLLRKFLGYCSDRRSAYLLGVFVCLIGVFFWISNVYLKVKDEALGLVAVGVVVTLFGCFCSIVVLIAIIKEYRVRWPSKTGP